MAIHPHTTPLGVHEPGLPALRLLSDATPCPTPPLTAETVAMLDAIGPEVPEPPLIGAELRHGGARHDIMMHDLPESGPDLARAIHARRALEQALDHGTALLAALGLPRLVDAGFVQVDGDALEVVVAHLDAIDAPGEDLEPEDELLEPGGDDELDLGWSALHSQVNLGNNAIDADRTAPERHGRGFVRCGPDDAGDGADHEPSLGAPERREAVIDSVFGRVVHSGRQEQWAEGGTDDREELDDNGIGDLDGYHEQCGYAIAGALPWSMGGYIA